jgi:hypothetical protein
MSSLRWQKRPINVAGGIIENSFSNFGTISGLKITRSSAFEILFLSSMPEISLEMVRKVLKKSEHKKMQLDGLRGS